LILSDPSDSSITTHNLVRMHGLSLVDTHTYSTHILNPGTAALQSQI